MPYIPTEWHDGDIVTAEKLNKIEDALANVTGGGVLLVKESIEQVSDGWNHVLDKTAQEILDAYTDGVIVIRGKADHTWNDEESSFATIGQSEVGPGVELILISVTYGSHECVYVASSPSEYPVYLENGIN